MTELELPELDKTKALHLHLPIELVDKLDALAEKHHRNRSGQIRYLLSSHHEILR